MQQACIYDVLAFPSPPHPWFNVMRQLTSEHLSAGAQLDHNGSQGMVLHPQLRHREQGNG